MLTDVTLLQVNAMNMFEVVWCSLIIWANVKPVGQQHPTHLKREKTFHEVWK